MCGTVSRDSARQSLHHPFCRFVNAEASCSTCRFLSENVQPFPFSDASWNWERRRWRVAAKGQPCGQSLQERCDRPRVLLKIEFRRFASARFLLLAVILHPITHLSLGSPFAPAFCHDARVEAGPCFAGIRVCDRKNGRFPLQDCGRKMCEHPRVSTPRAPMMTIGHCCSPQTPRSRAKRSLRE